MNFLYNYSSCVNFYFIGYRKKYTESNSTDAHGAAETEQAAIACIWEGISGAQFGWGISV